MKKLVLFVCTTFAHWCRHRRRTATTSHHFRKPFFFSALITLSLTALAVYATEFRKTPPASQVWRIELRESGFHPQTLSVHAGDRVTFTTTLGKPFWPASDLHPTHELYPAFDPRKSVEPGTSWSFVFERPGTWKYHDHLYFLYRGTIEVLGEPQGANRDRAFLGASLCPSGTKRQECWEDAIEQAFTQGGLAAAFDALAAMYDADKAFALDCHLFAHAIGKKGYELFRRQGSIDLTTKSYYCGYGFYHGFVEALLHASADFKIAQEFCAYAGSKLAAVSAIGEAACYHGIGHGAVADGLSPGKSLEEVIKPALELCAHVGRQEAFIRFCASGAFNALGVAYRDSPYLVSIDQNDPYTLCKNITEPYVQRECYRGLGEIVLPLGGTNLQRAVQFADFITEETFRKDAVEFIAVWYRVGAGVDVEPSIRACRLLRPELQSPCIHGIAVGTYVTSPPGHEYLDGLAFCRLPLLTPEEQDACIKHLMGYFVDAYTVDVVTEICDRISDEFLRIDCRSFLAYRE